jgi:hypothetical protein
VAKVNTLVDDFAFQDDTKWSYAAGVTVSGGELVVPCTTDYPGASSEAFYDLTESSAHVKLVAVPALGLGSTGAFFEMSNASGGVRFLKEGASLMAQHQVTGTWSSQATLTYNASDHRWLRMSETGGVVTWWTSTNGENWTSAATWTATVTLTSLTVILFSGYWLAETSPGDAKFDNLNVAPGTVRTVPDAILAQTGLTGAVGAIQDDPDSPDGSWLTA